MLEHALPRLPDRLDRDFAQVEQPVMVRAQHGDVLQGVVSAVLSRFDVGDVARSLVPAADGTTVVELLADHHPERSGRGVDAVAWSASSHQAAVRFPLTGSVAVHRVADALELACRSLRRQEFHGLTAPAAWLHASLNPRARGVARLVSELARVATEPCLLALIRAVTPRDGVAALKARLTGDVKRTGPASGPVVVRRLASPVTKHRSRTWDRFAAVTAALVSHSHILREYEKEHSL